MIVDDFEIDEAGIWPVSRADALCQKLCRQGRLQHDLIPLCVLGRGASSTVYKALHIPSLEMVAQKVMPIDDSDKRRQMVKELRALYQAKRPVFQTADGHTGNIAHENDGLLRTCTRSRSHDTLGGNVIDFFNAFVDPADGTVSVLVEFVDGGSLQDLLDSGRCIHEHVIAQIASQVVKGLVYLHLYCREIHRDIKPANLLISSQGTVKISDFGIAREMCQYRLKLSGNGGSRDLLRTHESSMTFVGTVSYMSPERLVGDSYSCNADVWSLGLTLLSCILGKFPFADRAEAGFWALLEALREVKMPELPARFSRTAYDFVEHCLAGNPAERPSADLLTTHPFISSLWWNVS